MISKEAVEAFKRFYRDRGVYLNHGLDCHLSDALSAALPVLLEGKREEMAKVIDPEIYSPHSMVSREWTNAREIEALVKADRIIAMLGGGE